MPPLGKLKGDNRRKWFEELERKEAELNSTD